MRRVATVARHLREGARDIKTHGVIRTAAFSSAAVANEVQTFVTTGRSGDLKVITYPALKDNYGFVVLCEKSGEAAAIDTPDGEVLAQVLKSHNLKLTCILNTHHHFDHVGGNEYILEHFGPSVQVLGPSEKNGAIPGISRTVGSGDMFKLGDHVGRVLDVSGHTLGHIAYHFPDEALLFAGDAIFPLGCGRIFEGSPLQMYEALQTIASLPGDTKVYCAHEYSLSNAAFAQTVDPKNSILKRRIGLIKERRESNLPTIPTTIAVEKDTNPFLCLPTYTLDPSFHSKEKHEIFAEIRRMKDNF